MKWYTKALILLWGLALLALIAALTYDLNRFDSTHGGYEPPYTDFVGEPIQWDELERTETGLRKRGLILHTHIDGTSGMISFEAFGVRIDYRPLSERARAIHKPREAFARLGFTPNF